MRAATTQARRRAPGIVVLAVAAIATGVAAPMPAGADASRRSAPPAADADALVSYSVIEDLQPAIHRAGSTTRFPVGTWPGKVVAGQFDADPGGEAILYSYGTTQPDAMLQVTPTGDGIDLEESPLQIGGAFQPLVGDFDGNDVDDVLWYAPGPTRDYLWTFDDAGAHTSTPITVDGRYRPSVLDANGDGRSDVLWYGPGTLPDRLWLFGPGAVPASERVSISGSYQVVVGRFGVAEEGRPTDRVVFFAPDGPDWVWTFDDGGTPTSHRLPAIDGSYTAIGGHFVDGASDSIYFAGPGRVPDHLWTFGASPASVTVHPAPPQVTGAYRPVTGDYDGDGLTDIAWVGDRNPSRLWSFRPDGSVVGSPLPLPYRPSSATATVPIGPA